MKAARETMNQMIEAWKEIPDQPEEVSPPSESQASSKGMRYNVLCFFYIIMRLIVWLIYMLFKIRAHVITTSDLFCAFYITSD